MRRVLIVCEGSKTEPQYFEDFRQHLGLTSADIKVCGEECGTDPLSVVNYALGLYRDALNPRAEEAPFEIVYCVFDKDAHQTYVAAKEKVSNTVMRPGHQIYAITSVPCFEYWLLLHFVYSTAAVNAVGGVSAGARMMATLRNYIPTYGKGLKGVFAITKDQLDRAIEHAIRGERNSEQVGTDNPSTRVHVLMTELKSLRGQPPHN